MGMAATIFQLGEPANSKTISPPAQKGKGARITEKIKWKWSAPNPTVEQVWSFIAGVEVKRWGGEKWVRELVIRKNSEETGNCGGGK